ncbi:Hypothetical predicted protein [Mytilus galloprovincialis]|uniref:Putative nuclease HARBI1 n=1 Tax=Mytilus galloprovincialis TaxID=29158 RepID=A0A8B6E501_MYTGA|nr:Hypothetical predicted protein [Mytilus galloprovincialis]
MAAFMMVQNEGERLRKERTFRERSTALDILTDRELIERYRFPRQGILSLTDLVTQDIQRPTARCHAIPPFLQVMVTLRFLAKGDFLSETADIHGISKASASRCVEEVTSSICKRLQNIKLPRGNAEIDAVKEGFYKIARFPNVVGAVDGTLIPIQRPHEDEPAYICRKGFPAINVQAIANSDLRFSNIVVRWPGSTHDSFMLTNSSVPGYMDQIPNSWLLGDSGYPLKKWLITPLLHTPNDQETRNVIERSFGVLKSRFRCLHKTGGHLPYKPPKSVKIISSCFKLHNKCIDDGVPLLNIEDGGNEVEIENHIDMPANHNRDAQTIRQRLVNRF